MGGYAQYYGRNLVSDHLGASMIKLAMLTYASLVKYRVITRQKEDRLVIDRMYYYNTLNRAKEFVRENLTNPSVSLVIVQKRRWWLTKWVMGYDDYREIWRITNAKSNKQV